MSKKITKILITTLFTGVWLFVFQLLLNINLIPEELEVLAKIFASLIAILSIGGFLYTYFKFKFDAYAITDNVLSFEADALYLSILIWVIISSCSSIILLGGELNLGAIQFVGIFEAASILFLVRGLLFTALEYQRCKIKTITEIQNSELALNNVATDENLETEVSSSIELNNNNIIESKSGKLKLSKTDYQILGCLVGLVLLLIAFLHFRKSEQQSKQATIEQNYSINQKFSKIHVVQPGETLYSVAVKYNTKRDVLIRLNNLQDTCVKIDNLGNCLQRDFRLTVNQQLKVEE